MRRWFWVLGTCGVAALAGCSSDAAESSSTGESATTSASPLLASLKVSTGDLVPAFDPSVTDYEVTSLNSLYAVSVEASGDDGATVTVNGVAAGAGAPASVTLVPNQDIDVVVEANGVAKKTTIHYLPSKLPAYVVDNLVPDLAGSEDILLTPNETTLLMVDRAGRPLYYRTLAAKHQAADFQRHEVDGAVYYSYADINNVPTAGVLGGVRRIMNERFEDVVDLAPMATADHDAISADAHDFIYVGPEHYVLIGYPVETVDLHTVNAKWSAAAPVYEALVQEVDHGNVIFEWNSVDRPSLFTDSTDGNKFGADAPSDYLHMNAVSIDPVDGNFLVSLRHADEVLKIDRKTGATIWTLGGASDDFGLDADQLFSHQHHARRGSDGTITMFDNGNNAHATRTLSFTLDEANKKVTAFQVVYAKPSDRPDSSFLGSLFRPDPSVDRWLIGWGGSTDIPVTAVPSVTEIVAGAPVWQLTFTTPSVFSYRAIPVTR